MATAMTDRRIDIVPLEIDQTGGGRDAHVDAGMGFLKRRKPGQQPFGGEGRQRRDGQHMVVVPMEQTVGRQPQIVERRADAGKIFGRFGSERQRPVAAHEERNAKLLLETLDLMADRRLRRSVPRPPA